MQAKDEKKGGVETGSYVARCYSFVNLGHQKSPYKDGLTQQIILTWELPTELIEEGDRAGEPRAQSKFYSYNFNSKANLRLHIDGLTNGKFSEKEWKAGIDNIEEHVLGVPCMLTISPKKEAEGTTISAVSPVPKGMTVPPAHNPTVYYDVCEHNEKVFQSLPEWMRDKIDASDERSLAKKNDATNQGEGLPF